MGTRADVGWVMDQRQALPFSDRPPTVADVYVQTLSIGQFVFQLLAAHVGAVDEGHAGTVEGFFPYAENRPWD